jgi:hypothetical protein
MRDPLRLDTERGRFLLDMVLLEVFGFRHLSDEVAERICARSEREVALMERVRKGVLRLDREDARKVARAS